MKKRIIAAILAVFVLAALASCTKNDDADSETSAADAEQTTAENKMPDFTVYTEVGEKVTLYDKLGKPVVLNFWATWCPPCKSEMPAFNKLYAEYGEDIEFMMINLTDGERDTVEGVKAFLSENGYTFPVYYDSDMDAAATYGVSSIPMTVFIDSEGVMIDYHVGAMTEATLSGYLEEMKGN